MSFIGEIIGLMTVIAFWWKWLSLHSEIGDGAGDPQSLLARGEPCSICVSGGSMRNVKLPREKVSCLNWTVSAACLAKVEKRVRRRWGKRDPETAHRS